LCCCWFFSSACLPYVSSLSTLSTTHSCIKNWQSYIFQLYKKKNMWTMPAGWREAVNQTRTDKSMLKRKKDKQLSCFRYLCLFSCGGVQHILCCWFCSSACLPYVSSLSTPSTKHSCINNWQSYIFQLYKRKVWRYQRDSVKP
jgi:hypothetical protein